MCRRTAAEAKFVVMPGLVPGTHALLAAPKTWVAGTSPAMTREFGLVYSDNLPTPPRRFRAAP
jgi:hypothetical protein